MTTESATQRLLDALPDEPRYAELRGLLLHGRSEFSELTLEPEIRFVVREIDDYGEPSIFVGGQPPRDAILHAVRRNQQQGMVVAWPENADQVARVLPDWRMTRAPIYTLGEADVPQPDESDVPVLWLRPEHLKLIDEIPDDLRQWLEYAVGTPDACLASWEDGMPVSFCCSVHPSERWWDVAIDTLPRYQRRGHATRCAARMIERMRHHGREPVWCAEEHNVESIALAGKLGFRQVDSLVLFFSAE